MRLRRPKGPRPKGLRPSARSCPHRDRSSSGQRYGMGPTSGTVTRCSARPAAVDPPARSARGRRGRPADRRRHAQGAGRSWRWWPPRAGRSRATSWRRCSGRTPTTRPPGARCAGRCRRCGRRSATAGFVIDRARVALDPDGDGRPRGARATGERRSRLRRPRGGRRARARAVPGRLRAPRQPRLRRLAGGPGGPGRAVRSPSCSTGWPPRGWRSATPRGGRGRESTGRARTRSTSPASGGSSSCSPGRATAPARSASTARSSRCSTGSSAWRRCARRPSCTTRSATIGDRSPRCRPTADRRPERIEPEAAVAVRRQVPIVGPRPRARGPSSTRGVGAGTDGRVVVIEGEAGIGKTRLAEALADAVRAAGGIVLAARGYPGEAGIAYGPIAELLRAGLARPDGIGAPGVARRDRPPRARSRLVDLPAALRVPGRPGARDRERPGPPARRDRRALVGARRGPGPGSRLDRRPAPRRRSDPRGRRLPRAPADRPAARCSLLAWRREDLSAGRTRPADDLARIPDVAASVVARSPRSDRPSPRSSGPPTRSAADEAFIDASPPIPRACRSTSSRRSPAASRRRRPDAARGVEALLRERIASVGRDGRPGPVGGARSSAGRSTSPRSATRADGPRRRPSRRSRS